MSPESAVESGIPTPVGSTWDLALKMFNTELTRDRKKVIYEGKGRTSYPHCSLSDVLAVAARYASDAGTRSPPGFRGKMQDLVRVASRYCNVIDVMVQHSPQVTALVWGGIRLLIAAVAKDIDISEQIGDAIVFIVEQIGKWESYYQLHHTSRRVHSAISRLYAQIINFSVRAVKYRRYKGLVRVSLSLVVGLSVQQKLQSIFVKIRELSVTLENEAQLASQAAQIKEALEQGNFRSETRRRESANRTLEWLEPALSPPGPAMEWEAGTCEWVREHETYKSWARDGYLGPLWIHGIPGCGKSVIANYLTHNAGTRFLFTHSYALTANQGPALKISLAACILTHLSRSMQNVTTREHQWQEGLQLLSDQYPSCISCPFDKIWPHVELALASMPHTFTLIVDALDECRDTRHIRAMLKCLDTLGTRLPNSRVILTSRYRGEYVLCLPNTVCLAVDQTAVSLDILHFVRREIDRTPTLQPLRDDIILRVGRDAGGMFLWAKMMMECLKRASTTNTQRQRLGRFPSGLGAVYDQLLNDTGVELDDQELDLRRRIFLLLVAAERLLSPDEISAALALRSTAAPSPGDMLLAPDSTITRLCWPLVAIDVLDGRACLIHHSLREFLLSAPRPGLPRATLRLTQGDAHHYWTWVCLNQLSQPSFSDIRFIDRLLRLNVLSQDRPKLLTESSERSSLYEYAAFYWQNHVALCPADDSLALQIGQFIGSISFISWAESIFYLRPGCDLGPVLSTRTILLNWQALNSPGIRGLTNIDAFFTAAYEAALGSFGADNILHYLVLRRLGTYFNLAVQEHDRRFHINKTVMEGAQSILGPRHEFTLRSRTEFGIEKLLRGEYRESETILWQVYQTQSSAAEANDDKYETLSAYANALFHQLKLDSSIAHQRTASEGLLVAFGPNNKKYLKSQLFLAHGLEAKGSLAEAVTILDSIWRVWVPMNSRDEGLAMFAQIGMASVSRKMGDLDAALRHGTEVLENRQRVFGSDSPITADTVLHVAIICIDRGEYDAARGYLDLLPASVAVGSCRSSAAAAVAATTSEQRQLSYDNREWLHREYLARCLRASLCIQAGETEMAVATLKHLIRDASEAGPSWPSSHGILRARLLLSDVLRERSKPRAEVLNCFKGLVVPLDEAVAPTMSSCLADELLMLEVAETAVRHVMNNDVIEAQEVLQRNGLRWIHEETCWIPIGGPFPAH